MMGMSKSFGSSLFLVQEGDESSSPVLSMATRKRFKPTPDAEGEHSPLMGSTSSLGGSSPTINLSLLTTVLVVTIGSSLQFGYGTGVMNNSEQIIMEYFHHQEKEYTVLQWGTTVSCYGLGGLIGSVIGPKVIGEFCGRRATLLVNNIFLFISSYMIALAPVWWWQAAGRVFVGIVAGIATAVVPTYFAEISPIEIRGAVGTMHQLVREPRFPKVCRFLMFNLHSILTYYAFKPHSKGITVGILVSQALSTPSLNLLGSEDKWK